MSRFLHRPMFRRGGSTGEGITSGLRRGYALGSTGSQRDYLEEKQESITPSGSDFNLGAYISEPPELPKSSAGADFWLNFGTNILAQPGGRPILQTLGTAAKEPLSKYQEQKAYERMAPREEEIDLLKTFMTSKGEMMSGEGANIYKHSDKARLEKDALTQMYNLNEKWNPEWNTMTEEEKLKDPKYNAWQKEK